VEVLEARGNGGSVEPGLVGSEGLYVSEVVEEFSSVDELKDEIEIFGVLGESFEVDDEGVADLRVHAVFVVDVVNLLRIHDFLLVEKFKCIVLVGLLVLGDLDLAETTYVKIEVPLPSTRPIS